MQQGTAGRSVFYLSRIGAFVAAFLLLATSAYAKTKKDTASSAAHVPVVVDFDLMRFAGQWFEIARTDISAVPMCKNAVDTYALHDSDPSRLTALHSCTRAGLVVHRAQGYLYPVDPAVPARMVLEAHSTLGPNRYSDYLVVALDPDYQWAVIGEQSGTHMWILSRLSALPDATLQAIVAHLDSNLGYTGIQSRLRCVKQTTAAMPSCAAVLG